MKLLKGLKKLDTKNLLVGEIYDPQAYSLDKKGNPTGETKAISLNRVDAAIKNADGYYESVIDGTVYCDGSLDQIKKMNAHEKELLFFLKPETYTQATGQKGKVSKKSVVKEIQAINDEKTQSLGL